MARKKRTSNKVKKETRYTVEVYDHIGHLLKDRCKGADTIGAAKKVVAAAKKDRRVGIVEVTDNRTHESRYDANRTRGQGWTVDTPWHESRPGSHRAKAAATTGIAMAAPPAAPSAGNAYDDANDEATHDPGAATDGSVTTNDGESRDDVVGPAEPPEAPGGLDMPPAEPPSAPDEDDEVESAENSNEDSDPDHDAPPPDSDPAHADA